MALINCKECGKEISDMAKICPNCGYPMKNNKNVINKTNQQTNEKNKFINIYGKIGFIVIVIISLIIYIKLKPTWEMELILYAIGGLFSFYLSILIFILSRKKKSIIGYISSFILIGVFSFCCLVYIVNWEYIFPENKNNLVGNNYINRTTNYLSRLYFISEDSVRIENIEISTFKNLDGIYDYEFKNNNLIIKDSKGETLSLTYDEENDCLIYKYKTKFCKK